MKPPRVIDGAGVATALLFLACAAATIAWCGSMMDMPGMEMPGGWIMSMTWMRMPGQGWLGAAGMFLGMWAVMMVAMMMPVFASAVRRSGRAGTAPGFAIGYFGVWAAAGLAVYTLGVIFAEIAMRSASVSRATPYLAGMVVLLAGASQFTGWKVRRLADCRHSGGRSTGTSNYRAALRDGTRLGLRCVYCCAPLTAVLMVIGVMDLLAMALITIAISAERLMAAGASAARLTGAALVAGGVMMLHAL